MKIRADVRSSALDRLRTTGGPRSTVDRLVHLNSSRNARHRIRKRRLPPRLPDQPGEPRDPRQGAALDLAKDPRRRALPRLVPRPTAADRRGQADRLPGGKDDRQALRDPPRRRLDVPLDSGLPATAQRARRVPAGAPPPGRPHQRRPRPPGRDDGRLLRDRRLGPGSRRHAPRLHRSRPDRALDGDRRGRSRPRRLDRLGRRARGAPPRPRLNRHPRPLAPAHGDRRTPLRRLRDPADERRARLQARPRRPPLPAVARLSPRSPAGGPPATGRGVAAAAPARRPQLARAGDVLRDTPPGRAGALSRPGRDRCRGVGSR
jgi:hypothetical protein